MPYILKSVDKKFRLCKQRGGPLETPGKRERESPVWGSERKVSRVLMRNCSKLISPHSGFPHIVLPIIYIAEEGRARDLWGRVARKHVGPGTSLEANN